MSEAPLGTTRSVVLGVSDFDEACRFFTQALGFPLQFRDGSRWAQFSGGEVTIALAGNGEAPPGSVGLSIKCFDVDAAVTVLAEHGCRTLSSPKEGAHERRATVATPLGPVLHLYTSRRD